MLVAPVAAPASPWTLPLAGLTVVEVGEFIAIPYAGKLLRDLGARVIKVEPPAGDRARRFGPFPADRPHPEEAGLYRYINGGKLGVTLDLSRPTGRRLLRELAGTADILLHELRAGQAGAWRLTYADLAAGNPRLVVTTLTPFGSTGPYRDFRGNDLINWHASATGHRYLGEPDRPPLRAAWYHSDHFAAATAAMGAMLAIEIRTVTGRGQFVDISNVEAMGVSLVAAAELSLHHQGGLLGYRTGRLGLKGAPMGLLRCRNGWVFFYVLQADQWRRFIEVMGSPDWAKDPLFEGPSANRAPYKDIIYTLMEDWLTAHDKEEIFEACQAAGVPCGIIFDLPDLLAHPHLRERSFFEPYGGDPASGAVVPGAPFRPGDGLRLPAGPAPRLGEHNRAIWVDELGYAPATLAAWIRAGVIG